MNTAVIITKTEPEIKIKAQKIAKEMGISLSTAINGLLRHFISTKSITFRSEVPSEWMIRALKESKKDIKAGRVSPSFNDVDDAIAWLEDPKAIYKNGDRV